MITTIEKLAGNKVKIRFEADAEVFEQGMQAAYNKNRGRVQVPGFRKGRAPRKVIERMYGEGIFYDDAFEHIFPDAYEQAVKEHDVAAVGQPEVDIEQIGAGQPCVFTVEVYVRPEVKLGQYKGLEVPKHEHPVTDADVEAQVEQAREKVSRIEDVADRPAAEGDIVNIDYAGTVDGVAFEGGTAQGHALTIGSGQFIPGFEEQVVGMSVGEEKDLGVTFPAEYHAAELAGQAAVFHVKVNGIQVKELPEMDDDFVRDVSEFDTVDEYKADIRAKLEDDAEKHIDQAFESAAITAAVAQAEVDVPPPMTERQMDSIARDFEMRLMYQGLRLEDFLKYTGQTREVWREQYRAQAEQRVKTTEVIDAICAAEKLEASQDDIDAEMRDYAEQGKQSLEEFKATLSEDDLAYFADVARAKKAVALIKETAIPVPEEHDHDHDHDHDHAHGHDHNHDHDEV